MDMKVFGIGLNKTGTTSLGKALKILGFNRHIGSDGDMTKLWSEKKIEPVLKKAQLYNNFEDWPWPLLYQEFFATFENAKFILTIRDSPEVWYQSLCKHALKTGPSTSRKRIYGYYMPHDFKKEHINFYNTHNDNVIRFFENNAPENLLVLSFKDGNNWGKMCPFLGLEIPDVEFPILNKNNRESVVVSNPAAVKLIKAGKRLKNKVNKILLK